MKPRILIVEDEEALATLLRYNLEREGFEVETVVRGDEADTRLKEQAPDLAILDWMLPGLSGIELTRRLRTRRGATMNLWSPSLLRSQMCQWCASPTGNLW